MSEKNKSAQAMANLRWDKATPDDKKAQLKKMNEGRKLKAKNKTNGKN